MQIGNLVSADKVHNYNRERENKFLQLTLKPDRVAIY
jgi:hypothetical protein